MKKMINTLAAKINEKLFFVQHFSAIICILFKYIFLLKVNHGFNHTIAVI